jgi:LuxR family transcriptional regulator, maltose regulon positive regulatory protein
MLISPKLHIPPLRVKMLLREHLVDRLATGGGSRLLLVTGNAGSGKTSIVCQWIEREKPLVAWYSLDDADNDPDLFFRYLMAALGALDAGLGTALEPCLEGQKRLKGPEIGSRLVDCLSALPTDVYLVLDDYHLITSSEIHDALAYLLNQALPRFHTVIISRNSMPFSVSRLKIRNQMAEISSEEMRFTYKETEQFFREIIPVKLSAGQIQELTGHMEGWVGGLQLFGLSLKGKETVDALSSVLSRASEEAADYLIDEVVNTQPARVKEFLCATALLERFNTDLCREVTGQAEAGEMLDYAYRNNLFLVPLDNERKWYRYHHLFARAVRKKARMSSAAWWMQVYRSAALWFAATGYLEDAFRHAFASEDIEFAADMLEDYLMVLYEQYEIASFRRWMQKLPRGTYARRALLMLFDCRFKIETVQLSDVPAILKQIEDHRDEVLGRYEGYKRKLCDDLLLLFRRILPHWSDPENVDIPRLEEALRQISPENRALSAFRTTIPFGYFYKGQMLLAREALKQAWESVSHSGNRTGMMIWFRVAATIERFRGRLRQSEAVLEEGYVFLQRSGLSGAHLKFMLDLQMAWVSYLRNDVEKAFGFALTVLRYVEQTRFLYEIVDVNYLLSLILVARGETDKAARSMQRIQRAARSIGTPSLVALTDAYVARLRIAGGNIEAAEEWMDRRQLSMTEPFSLRFALECLTHAEVLSLRGGRREALSMLKMLRSSCVGQNMMEAVLEINILRSANLYALNDRHTARTVMEEALRFSEPEGYVRPFVERAGVISPLLSDMARSRSEASDSSHFNAILNACGITENAIAESNGSRRSSGIANLTRREVEILELMAAGHRDKEIAEKAFISLHTAKTHIKHIFGKLDVTTRVQAIRRAEEMKSR